MNSISESGGAEKSHTMVQWKKQIIHTKVNKTGEH